MLIRYADVITLFPLVLWRLLLLIFLFLLLLRVEEPVIILILTVNFDILGSLPLFPSMTLWVDAHHTLMLLIRLIMLGWRTATHLPKL